MIASSKSAINTLDTEKYSHPIPNRQYILALLQKSPRALSRKQLEQQLGLSCKEEYEALRRRLRAMERDGQLTFTPREGYRPIGDSDMVQGRVVGHHEGFGFLQRDGGDDLLLSKRDMLQLFDGDIIQARISGEDRRGREKATLQKILERNTHQVVGQLCLDGDDYYVKPLNSRIAHEIDIDAHATKGATVGQFVVVNITDYPCSQYNAAGVVDEVLEQDGPARVAVEVALREHQIPFKWSKPVTRAAKSIGRRVSAQDKLHRLDLRDTPFVTIDGEDAKDFDDAVYCESSESGFRLFVAIADVSHYVTPDSPLDKEAQKRGTSVYFPGHVVPMLPESLSNGLCSLNPHVDRLVLVCEMDIDHSGKMKDYRFAEAVIHSHARLTYDQVDAVLTRSRSALARKMRRKHAELIPHLSTLYELYEVLKQARASRGSLDFESQEVSFRFDQENQIQGLHALERNDAHKLIEECMLCANVATARFLKRSKLPVLYRNHNGPEDKKLQQLRDYLGQKSLNLAGGKKPSPQHFKQLLSGLGDRSDAGAIESMMLKSLGQAQYQHKNSGHFGLAYPAYAHFTSPIRRYPDLLVHRAIRAIIRRQESGGKLRQAFKSLTGLGMDPVRRVQGAEALDTAQSYPYDLEQMKNLATQCSQLSRRADKASWDVDAWLKCEYMSRSIGQQFDGVITAITRFGLFVEIEDKKIEGLVHISTLGTEHFHLDEAKQCLVGERSKTTYALGDSVSVQLERVDMGLKKMDFTLLTKRKAR